MRPRETVAFVVEGQRPDGAAIQGTGSLGWQQAQLCQGADGCRNDTLMTTTGTFGIRFAVFMGIFDGVFATKSASSGELPAAPRKILRKMAWWACSSVIATAVLLRRACEWMRFVEDASGEVCLLEALAEVA
jgi:hypothetical protein